MRRFCLLAILISLVPAGPTGAEDGDLHEWTSTGGHKVKAALVRSEIAYVLRKDDGTEVRVSAGALSDDARALAEAILARRASGTSGLNIVVGEVVNVVDGDTLDVLDDANARHRVRLEGIDCPEAAQDHGAKATEAIRDKLIHKRVRLEWMTKDGYDRVLADIHLGDRWINREMVAEGWAWHYKKYSDSEVLADAESKARAAKAGLWQDNSPVPPWEFRRNEPRKGPRSGL